MRDTTCGGEIRAVAFISEAMAVRELPTYLGEPTSVSPMVPARGPRVWEMPDAASIECDPQAQAAPVYEFDQCVVP